MKLIEQATSSKVQVLDEVFLDDAWIPWTVTPLGNGSD